MIGEGVVNVLGCSRGPTGGVPILLGPVPGPDPGPTRKAGRFAATRAGLLRSDVVHELRQLLPESGGSRRAEVDLEIGAVKSDPDVLDIVGGAVDVVDQAGAALHHADNQFAALGDDWAVPSPRSSGWKHSPTAPTAPASGPPTQTHPTVPCT